MSGSPPSDGGAPETYHRGRIWREAALVAALLGAIAWWRWRPFRIEIDGSSMRPALEHGDWALALAARSLRRGDVVVVAHPQRRGLEIVKRVVATGGERAPDGRELGPREIWVEGDAPTASTDSRRFGPLEASSVAGRVVVVWWPPHRWGRISRA